MQRKPRSPGQKNPRTPRVIYLTYIFVSTSITLVAPRKPPPFGQSSVFFPLSLPLSPSLCHLDESLFVSQGVCMCVRCWTRATLQTYSAPQLGISFGLSGCLPVSLFLLPLPGAERREMGWRNVDRNLMIWRYECSFCFSLSIVTQLRDTLCKETDDPLNHAKHVTAIEERRCQVFFPFVFPPVQLFFLREQSVLWSFFNILTVSAQSRWPNHSSAQARQGWTHSQRELGFLLQYTANWLDAQLSNCFTPQYLHRIHLHNDLLIVCVCMQVCVCVCLAVCRE